MTESMTIDEYNEWIKKNPMELGKNVCQLCGRRINKKCYLCFPIDIKTYEK
jgi:hypothetical protein